MAQTDNAQSIIAHPDRLIVLFDGSCNLCNSSVHFIIDRDPGKNFYFAPLQGKIGRQLQRECDLDIGQLDSIILFEATRVYTRSTAVLRIARRLAFPWCLAVALRILPAGIRDYLYDLLARNRYRWFGQRESCRMPTPESRERFLE